MRDNVRTSGPGIEIFPSGGSVSHVLAAVALVTCAVAVAVVGCADDSPRAEDVEAAERCDRLVARFASELEGLDEEDSVVGLFDSFLLTAAFGGDSNGEQLGPCVTLADLREAAEKHLPPELARDLPTGVANGCESMKDIDFAIGQTEERGDVTGADLAATPLCQDAMSQE